MKASEFPWDKLLTYSVISPEVGMTFSFVQVEYGLDELKAHWEGFRDAADYHNLQFDDRNHIITHFAHELHQWLSDEVGQQIPQDS